MRRRRDRERRDRSVALGLTQFLLSALMALLTGGTALSFALGTSVPSPWPALGAALVFAALAVGCWRKQPDPSLYGAAGAAFASTNVWYAIAGDPYPNLLLVIAWGVLAWSVIDAFVVWVQRRQHKGGVAS